MRILGVDPGSRRLGWGVVEAVGSRLQHVASGTIAAPAAALTCRLVFLAQRLEEAMATHLPHAASVEQVFHAKNSHSALVLGQARGAALLCLGRGNLRVFEYPPSLIKQATTGSGRADKLQVQAMVRMLLGLQGALGLDTSDALAAAIGHAQRSGGPFAAASP